jgi:propanediol dehydratase small subunit
MIVTISTIIVVLILAASVVWAAFFGGQLPQPFHGRTCQGKGWRQTFPSAPKQELREFLSVFVEAFAFSSKEKLKFSPDDQILQVYRALYPSKWLPDALEVETLAKDVEAKYGFTLESIWHENLTLGELFAKTQKGSQA